MNGGRGPSIGAAGSDISCLIYRASTLGIAAFTNTVITYTNEAGDAGGFWNGGAPTRLTIPSDGLYIICGGVAFTPGAGGAYHQLWFSIDGAASYAGDDAKRGDSDPVNCRVNATYMGVFTAGQYVESVVYCGSASTLEVPELMSTWVAAWRIKG